MESPVVVFVKDYISKNGFKQKAIAERAGYSQYTFSNMLNGRKLITDMDILQICKALSVSPNDLFGQTKHKSATA